MEQKEKPVIRSGIEARQGVILHVMRYVLGFGIAGVVVALFIAWYVTAS